MSVGYSKTVTMWITFLVFLSIFQFQQVEAQSTVSGTESGSVILTCTLTGGSFTLPEWRGPPNDLIYTILDDVSEAINPNAPAANRLQFASNKRDLVMSNAQLNDSGVYKCSYTLLGEHTVTLTVTASSCKCECDCGCRTIVIVSMVFGILGTLGLVIVIGGLLIGCFDERKTLLLVFDGIGIVSDVLSLVLSIVVKVKECCEENCECCEEDSECCKDWIDNAATAFIVIPCLAVVASVVIFVLVKLDIIGPGRNGGKDGGNNGGRGHGGGRGPNSNTVNSGHEDTHRGTLSDRANSDSEVSRKDVHVQENRDNFSGRPMPPIPPLTDKKGRGLSANYDDDHPMTSVGIPDKKAGQLVPLKEQEEQKKKEESKKRRKRKKKAVSDDDDDDDDVV